MVDDTCHTSQPVLPPELEQEIVETAALMMISFPLMPMNCALELQLTGRRFREWTMPFLYRLLHTDKFFVGRTESECIEILSKYGRRTTHVYLGLDTSKAITILEHCPNVQDIVNWHEEIKLSDIHPSIQKSSNLRRLSAFLEELPTNLLLSPAYSSITHLDVMDWMDWDLLVNFPNLSHLCFTDSYEIPHVYDVIDRLTHKDHGCKSLRVIICLYLLWGQSADARFIKLLLPDTHVEHEAEWMKYSNGGMDFWEFAERMVFARKGNWVSE
ncbi:hypothetical protein CVT24_001110 [Panaeolus cyanescens]|uniref:F-box domain-containing protein n=1 Tax=Panaeolus cyanescens TaxID=181874 RepID=A0A409W6R6_9AGAR|nr:hypothetical protein CVT24_001110 [Panaeolus cyanescens]